MLIDEFIFILIGSYELGLQLNSGCNPTAKLFTHMATALGLLYVNSYFSENYIGSENNEVVKLYHINHTRQLHREIHSRTTKY